MANHMDYTNRQRAAFIMECLTEGGVSRQHLMDHFGVSVPTASAIFKRFLDEYPDCMAYDPSAKRYVAGAAFGQFQESQGARAAASE